MVEILWRIHFCSYIGEWKSTGQIPATEEEKSTASGNCYTVAAIYSAFFVTSVGSLVYYRAKRRRR
jgi:hypothetical protein